MHVQRRAVHADDLAAAARGRPSTCTRILAPRRFTRNT